jgi:hypothetical protein
MMAILKVVTLIIRPKRNLITCLSQLFIYTKQQAKLNTKHFAETNYTNTNPYKINWWGPYWMPQQLALLRLTTLSNVSSTAVNNIRNQKAI